MSGSRAFRSRVAQALADRQTVAAVQTATWRKVDARAASLKELHNPEELRDLAAAVKRHTLANLAQYLEQFVEQVRRHGGQVHLAADAAAARSLVCKLARSHGARLAVKVKSMTTEEVGLNAALEAAGVQVVETDLGEFILQLAGDRPSHITAPVIHKDRRQIGTLMTRALGATFTDSPAELAQLARRHLRDVFRRCDLGISGVNFAIAETGTICICTNEGNGRMCTTRPRVHVALMGIEKVIPRWRDLPVFLKLLSRSSGGQPLGSYTTLITGPKRHADLDGPDALHVILLDNGRADILAGPFAEVLACVRCGACLNACPVYRHIGGHAYNSVYPGPIGSLVTPLLRPDAVHDDLPRASSLCGACQAACPVKIDIPGLLVGLRAAGRARQPWSKRVGFRAWLAAMHSPRTYRCAQTLMRVFLPDDGEGWARGGVGPLGRWTMQRDLQRPAANTFRQLWERGLRDEP